MKLFYSLFIALATFGTASAQYTNHTFTFDSVARKYILYVPANYDSTKQYPVVLALHGLGDNMTNFKNGIRLNLVADTAQFIFVIPEALVDGLSGATAWNSGAGAFGITLNPDVNDVGFLNALLDTVTAHYNVDQTRLYSCGFSMGGFMTNRLGCELNNRLAAIASVSGTIGNGITCNPTRAIPAVHFHGTSDGTVAYTGNTFGNDAEALVAYWRTHDGCDSIPSAIDTLPNTANDGKTVVHFKYPNGKFGTEVEFYQVIGGQHEWLAQPTNDVTYTVEIWNFFRRFKWDSQDTTTTLPTGINSVSAGTVAVYPNPTAGQLNIQVAQGTPGNMETRICDLTGKILYYNNTTAANLNINTREWSDGMYLLQVTVNGERLNKKILVSK